MTLTAPFGRRHRLSWLDLAAAIGRMFTWITERHADGWSGWPSWASTGHEQSRGPKLRKPTWLIVPWPIST